MWGNSDWTPHGAYTWSLGLGLEVPVRLFVKTKKSVESVCGYLAKGGWNVSSLQWQRVGTHAYNSCDKYTRLPDLVSLGTDKSTATAGTNTCLCVRRAGRGDRGGVSNASLNLRLGAFFIWFDQTPHLSLATTADTLLGWFQGPWDDLRPIEAAIYFMLDVYGHISWIHSSQTDDLSCRMFGSHLKACLLKMKL